MRDIKYSDLTKVEKELLDNAEKAMDKSYNPYSQFSVGSAFLSQDGRIISGANFENAAYSPSICAERSTLMAANSQGIRTFDKVAVIARGKDFDTMTVTAPCGVCRQSLFECAQVSGKDLEIIMSNTKKDRITIATISELLPLAFGPADIGVVVTKYK